MRIEDDKLERVSFCRKRLYVRCALLFPTERSLLKGFHLSAHFDSTFTNRILALPNRSRNYENAVLNAIASIALKVPSERACVRG